MKEVVQAFRDAKRASTGTSVLEGFPQLWGDDFGSCYLNVLAGPKHVRESQAVKRMQAIQTRYPSASELIHNVDRRITRALERVGTMRMPDMRPALLTSTLRAVLSVF